MDRVHFDERLGAVIAQARSHSLGDIPRRSARRQPDKTAIIDGDIVLTFAEFDHLVDRAAAALRDNGFAVGLAEGRDAAALMASGYAAKPGLLRSALKHLFSARKSDWDRFDGIFDAFWLGRRVRSRSLAVGSSKAANNPSLKALQDAGARDGGASSVNRPCAFVRVARPASRTMTSTSDNGAPAESRTTPVSVDPACANACLERRRVWRGMDGA